MIGTLTLVAVSFFVGASISSIGWQKHYQNDLKKAKKRENEWKKSAMAWHNRSKEMEDRSLRYENELNTYISAYRELLHRDKGPAIEDEIREAIKYAMTNSHPDKPTGDQEQFIKFHRLYKKYCK